VVKRITKRAVNPGMCVARSNVKLAIHWLQMPRAYFVRAGRAWKQIIVNAALHLELAAAMNALLRTV